MQHYQQGLCRKLGLPHQSASLTLAFEWLTLLEDNLLDYTNSFRALLGLVAPDDHPHEQQLLATMVSELDGEALQVWQEWRTRYLTQIEQQSELSSTNISNANMSTSEVIKGLQNNNPVYVLRNSMAQHAIDAAEQGQFEEVARLYTLLASPYHVQDIATERDSSPPAPHAPQLPISCSS
jgi:uncharacterized protein YdiU (UPF0061 family)